MDSTLQVTLQTTNGNIHLVEQKEAPFVLHDQNLTVPDNGRQYVQVLWDYDIYGMSRQEYKGIKSDFDHPQLANGDYGLHRHYPGFKGKEYSYVSLTDSYFYLMDELLKWAANKRLQPGKVVYWYEKVKNKETGRRSYITPVRKPDDGGWFAHVEPMGSYLWAYNEMTMDGKSNSDADNWNYGAWDPIMQINPGKSSTAWLHGFYAGSLHEAFSYGSYWQFPCIDSTQKTAPSLDEVLSKGLYHWANAASRKRLPDGRNVTSDFPCVAEPLRSLGLPSVGTPMLTLGRGPWLWIKKKSCSPILPAGTPWSPYKKLW